MRFYLALRTSAPWWCIVRVVSLTRSRKTPTRKLLPGLLRGQGLAARRRAAPKYETGDPTYVIASEKGRGVVRAAMFLDYVRRSGTTRAPHVCPQRVRGAKRNRTDGHPRFSLLLAPPALRYNREIFEPQLTEDQRVRAASRSIPPPWGSIRFRVAPRTYASWGCIVRVVTRTKSRKIPTRNV